jgi:ribosomal protein L32
MKHEPRKPQKLGAEAREAERAVLEEINLHSRTLEKCPECGEKLVRDGGCMTCLSCGWNACSV